MNFLGNDLNLAHRLGSPETNRIAWIGKRTRLSAWSALRYLRSSFVQQSVRSFCLWGHQGASIWFSLSSRCLLTLSLPTSSLEIEFGMLQSLAMPCFSLNQVSHSFLCFVLKNRSLRVFHPNQCDVVWKSHDWHCASISRSVQRGQPQVHWVWDLLATMMGSFSVLIGRWYLARTSRLHTADNECEKNEAFDIKGNLHSELLLSHF